MQYPDEEMLVRAQLAAVRSFGHRFLPLMQREMLEVAVRESRAYYCTLDRSVLTPEQQETRLIQAARVAIGAAIHRQTLIAEIREALPIAQRIALSLQYEHAMSDAETAAVLSRTGHLPGCTAEQAAMLIAQAVESLGQRAR